MTPSLHWTLNNSPYDKELMLREATLESGPVHPRISGMIEKMSASMATRGH